MDVFSWWQIALICVGCVLCFFIMFAVGVSATLNGVVFSRQDKNPEFKYFTEKDFNLKAEDIAVTYRGESLYAKIYSVKPVEKCEKVVIFQHGFGAGTSSYMTEIAALAGYGFAVVAADAYGCNNSAGKKVYGFYAGTEAVIAAYIGVKSQRRLSDKKVFLVGHSWGAYSVLCAAEKIKADGVVALSGFNAPAQCICDQLKLISRTGKLIVPLLHPFLYLLNILRFGFKGNTHAAKAIEKSGVKALLIHGEKDRTVLYKHSAAAKAHGDNITSLVLTDKKHNPYNTVAAEAKLSELLSEKKEDREEFLKNFDWKAATEEDVGVMANIASFIQSA